MGVISNLVKKGTEFKFGLRLFKKEFIFIVLVRPITKNRFTFEQADHLTSRAWGASGCTPQGPAPWQWRKE
jgi:hypothetical protein